MVLMMEETPSNENSEVHSITPPPNDATPIAVAVAVADADADADADVNHDHHKNEVKLL